MDRPQEQQRVKIEAAIADLDQQKLRIDKWMADQKAAAKAKDAAPASPATPAAAPGAVDDRIAKLKELASLKEAGVLTEAEFQAEKQRFLASSQAASSGPSQAVLPGILVNGIGILLALFDRIRIVRPGASNRPPRVWWYSSTRSPAPASPMRKRRPAYSRTTRRCPGSPF